MRTRCRSYSLPGKLVGCDHISHMVLTMFCYSHGAVDDPDASIIYDEVTKLIVDKYPQYQKDIVVMRVPPSDQSQFLF
jgi:hypothetical protein